MTNEEIQRTMEFIIKQQKSFSEGMEQLRAAQTKAEARLSNMEMGFVALFNTVTEITKTVKEIAEAQKRTDEQLAETSDRLNIFITTVERYISGERNGNAQG
jgi:predicted  nucleic acid-binding Zn-ribbon protein